jgi:hypothetical protein
VSDIFYSSRGRRWWTCRCGNGSSDDTDLGVRRCARPNGVRPGTCTRAHAAGHGAFAAAPCARAQAADPRAGDYAHSACDRACGHAHGAREAGRCSGTRYADPHGRRPCRYRPKFN